MDPKEYYRYQDNPTAYRRTDNVAVDLPTYQKETGQQVGLGAEKTDFGRIETIPMNSPFKATSPIVSSSSIQQQKDKEILDYNKSILDKDKEIQSLSRDKAIADLKAGLNVGEAPTKPDLAQEYLDTRTGYGLDVLEGDLNATRQQVADLEAETRKGREELRNRPILGTVATAQEMQYARTQQDELDRLNRKQQTLTDLYNTKQTVVSNIMSFKQTDYNNAVAEYNTKFNQNMQVQNAINTKEQQMASEENAARDDARANLTTLQNLIKDSGKSWDTVDIATKMNIQSLEMKAGIPTGTFQEFARSMPKANLLATKDGYDAGGNEIVSFIYADENGNPGVVRTIKTGGVRAPTGDGTWQPGTVGTTPAQAAKKGYKMTYNSQGGINFTGPGGKGMLFADWINASGVNLEDALKNSRDPGDRAFLNAYQEVTKAAQESNQAKFIPIEEGLNRLQAAFPRYFESASTVIPGAEPGAEGSVKVDPLKQYLIQKGVNPETTIQ